MPSKDKHITKENAREMQARGVAKRKENTARRKAMRELVLDELTKPIKEGSKTTKLEWLIAKAIGNVKDDVSIKNLIEIQDLLGERQVNNIVNLTANVPTRDEVLAEIRKELKDDETAAE